MFFGAFKFFYLDNVIFIVFLIYDINIIILWGTEVLPYFEGFYFMQASSCILRGIISGNALYVVLK